MTRQKLPTGFGVLLLISLTVILYWQFYLLGKIPMPGDTLIGAYFPWLDYKWGFSIGVPVKNALISDVFSQFFIWKYLAMDILKGGQFPLWNPYALSGTPFMATYHSSVFNPFNLLLLLPKYYGWGLFVSMQTFTAMLGMFLFLGLKVKLFWVRIFGAVIFSLSGLLTTWVEFGTGVWAASMLPWIFLFIDKFFKTSKIRFLFLMSAAFVVLYLSGHAQLTLYSTILTLLYAFVIFLKNRKTYGIFLPALFIILAVLFCSFQFIPAFEFAKNSIREQEAYSSSFNYGLNPWYEVVKFFAPDFFGNPSTGNYWDSESYHEQSVFLGTIPFILILTFIIYTFRQRKINFWIGVFLGSLVLGFDNPVSKIIYSLPLSFLTYSSAARIFFLTSFSGAVLAAMALEKLFDERFKKYFLRTNIYFLAIIIGTILGFLAIVSFLRDFQYNPEIFKIIGNYKVTIKNLILPFGVGLFSLVSFLIFRSRPKPGIILVILFVSITYTELSRYFYKYNPFIAQDLVFPKTPAIEFLQNQDGLFRIARGDREVMPPNTWIFYNLQSIEGYDPLISKDYAKVFNLINGFDFNATPSRYRELEKYESKFLDALNVRFLLTVKRDSEGRVKGDFINPKLLLAGYKSVYEDGNTAILENPNVKMRAYYVSQVKSFEIESDLEKAIKVKDFDPTEQALVVSSNEYKNLSKSGSVQITSYAPNKVYLKTNTGKNSFLVFSDTFDPGWKLFRNGTQEKLFKVNFAFRGFPVPEGENEFIMVYFPDSFRYGLWLSGLALAGYGGIFFYSLRKKNI